jgi:hypothetical protein
LRDPTAKCRAFFVAAAVTDRRPSLVLGKSCDQTFGAASLNCKDFFTVIVAAAALAFAYALAATH